MTQEHRHERGLRQATCPVPSPHDIGLSAQVVTNFEVVPQFSGPEMSPKIKQKFGHPLWVPTQCSLFWSRKVDPVVRTIFDPVVTTTGSFGFGPTDRCPMDQARYTCTYAAGKSCDDDRARDETVAEMSRFRPHRKSLCPRPIPMTDRNDMLANQIAVPPHCVPHDVQFPTASHIPRWARSPGQRMLRPHQ